LLPFVFPATDVFLSPMKPLLRFFLSFILVVFIFFSCKKESFTTSADALLKTSVDTLHFDTVFTTTGSTSQFIKIINENNKGLHISSVRLSGGLNSPFKINVDGLPGPQVSNVEIPANDSVYIYVTVTINPNAANLAFVVRDSIEIIYNGNKRWVQLDAYGQNAHFFRDKVVTGTETWNNDLPYVILGRLTVDSPARLTINKGCRVYMHADAPFIVHGILQVNGEKYDSTRVIFTGDRLDEPYKDFPASWPGIIFSDVSRTNIINYTTIKNAYQGIIVVDPSTSGTKLTLNETVIENAYDVGIAAINTTINGRNLLISNCGQNMFLIGGTYNFTHCTMASFSNAYIPHKKPVLTLYDSYEQNGSLVIKPLTATFTNCIIWGEENGFVPNEVDILKKGANFSVSFNKVLWRMKTNPTNVVYDAINADPLFDSINTTRRYFNFNLRSSSQVSPAINAGVNTPVNIDLNGNMRPLGIRPDLGAYEKQ
jgi:hypothetical protein